MAHKIRDANIHFDDWNKAKELIFLVDFWEDGYLILSDNLEDAIRYCQDLKRDNPETIFCLRPYSDDEGFEGKSVWDCYP